MDIETAFLIVIALIASYLIGSIPTAYIMGRLRRSVDIRNIGSKNMGGMNVVYNVGVREGVLVIALDIGKGALAVFITDLLGLSLIFLFISGIVTVLGHNFSIFLGFRGGKGGAACIGILLYLIPWAVPAYAVLFVILLVTTRVPTISYSVAFICFPIIAWFVYRSLPLVIYTPVLLLMPGLMYIPRLKEMYHAGGDSWKRVFFRKDIKDRL